MTIYKTEKHKNKNCILTVIVLEKLYFEKKNNKYIYAKFYKIPVLFTTYCCFKMRYIIVGRSEFVYSTSKRDKQN